MRDDDMTVEENTTRRFSGKRLAKRIGIGLAGAVALVVVLVAVLLLSPFRGKVLTRVLKDVGTVIPGDFSIGVASWPALGTIELSDILWTDAGDTLVIADRVKVDVRLKPLVYKDVHVEELVAVGVCVDIPAITARFESDKDSPPDEPKKDGTNGFPRVGSLPGVPSIAVESVYVTSPMIRVDDELTITGVVVSAGLDVSYGRRPVLRVDTLTAKAAADEWSVDGLSLVLDLDRGRVDGKGRAHFPPYGSVHLTLSSDESDRIALVLTTEENYNPPEQIGVSILAEVAHEGARVKSIDFEGQIKTPGTQELAKIPGLESKFKGLPDLDGVSLDLKGRTEFTPEFQGDITIVLKKNNWVEHGDIVAGYRNGALDVQRFDVDFSELALRAHARIAPDSVGIYTIVDCRGSSWLALFAPDVEAPQPLSAQLTVEAARAPDSSTISAAVRGNGNIGGFEFDELDITAIHPGASDGPSRIDFTIHSVDTYLGLGAEVSLGETIAAKLSPIVLQTIPVQRSQISVRGSDGGSVAYTASTRRVVADPVRVSGEAGELALWTDLVLDGDGHYKLAVEWSDPPRLLTRRLGLTEGKLDTLAAAWSVDAPYKIDIEGTLGAADGPRITAAGKLMLPGPRNLAPLLPDSASVADLGPVVCDLTVSTWPDSGGTGYRAAIDFGGTAWIDSSAIIVTGSGGAVEIDTLNLVLQGINLSAKGTIGDGTVDLEAILNVTDSEFAGRFVPSLPQFNVYGSARVEGPLKSPGVIASMEGAVSTGSVDIPSFVADLDFDSTRVKLDLETPQGISTPHLELNHTTLSVRSIGGANTLVPVRLSMTAEGENINLRQSLRVDTVGGITVDIDTLEFDIGGRDLHADRPFQVRLPRDSDRIVVDGLGLTGELGFIYIDGFLAADSSSLDGVISVDFPEEQPPALSRVRPWPDNVYLEFDAEGKHNLTVSSQVTGFELVDGRRPEMDLTLTADSEHIAARLTVGDSTGAIVESDLRLPAVLSLYPFAFDYHKGDVLIDAAIVNMPIVMRMLGETGEIPEDETVSLDGTLAIRGPVDSPYGRAVVGVDFTGWPKFSRYGLSVDAAFGTSAQRDSLATAADFPDVGATGERSTSDQRGAEALVRLSREDGDVLSIEGFYPIEISIDPPGARTPEDGEVAFRVNSSDIELVDFDPLLPIDVGLGGIMTINLSGSGSVRDPGLDGSLRTNRFEVRVAEQARMIANSNIRVEGTVLRPVIKGEIVIESGLIRVPDLPENLHPVEGDAILLRTQADSLGGEDSTLVSGGSREAPDSPKSKINPDLSVEIKIPSGFWIRGKGLDLELSGNLTVKQQEGVPTVTGELRATRGSLIVLGRTLQLERGTVTFYGADEINPSLDVVLATTIDGTEIQIIMGGTVEEPAVNLVSSPEMSESDIMSVLLFGRTFDDLDDGQADLVKKRSTEMIASLGAAKLQEEFGGQVGVDVVSITSTGRDNEGTALTVGKYLNPRALLSYAQALDPESDSFVSLEYFLRGQFRLESTYGQRGQTSLGFGWSKDY